jgi:hypothetical protein
MKRCAVACIKGLSIPLPQMIENSRLDLSEIRRIKSIEQVEKVEVDYHAKAFWPIGFDFLLCAPLLLRYSLASQAVLGSRASR